MCPKGIVANGVDFGNGVSDEEQDDDGEIDADVGDDDDIDELLLDVSERFIVWRCSCSSINRAASNNVFRLMLSRRIIAAGLCDAYKY